MADGGKARCDETHTAILHLQQKRMSCA